MFDLKRLWRSISGTPAPRPPVPKARPLRTKADLDELIEDTGFEDAARLIRGRARPCLHLIAAGSAADAPLGTARLGGLPDLSATDPWPTSADGRAMTFYAQIDLATLPPGAAPEGSPKQGLLSVFGGEIENLRSEVRALLTPAGGLLERRSPPAEIAALNPVTVALEPGVSLPVDELAFGEALERRAPDGDIDALNDAIGEAPEGGIGQLFGWAVTAVDDLHLAVHMDAIGRPDQERLFIWKSWKDWECAKAMESRLRNGTIYRPWSASDDDNVRWILANRKTAEAAAHDWIALLRVESNKAMNLWINDADPIVFFIRKDDLAAGDFSKVRARVTQG